MPPKRWLEYESIGSPIEGTKLIPFKVPLKEKALTGISKDDWFTPDILVSKLPTLKAVIDLTNTNKYYSPEDFTKHGIIFEKINLVGRTVPKKSNVRRFIQTVDSILDQLTDQPDALIGVHCTHGLNRTGYVICKYMISRMEIDPREALDKFQEARGYEIERKLYVKNILNGTEKIQKNYVVNPDRRLSDQLHALSPNKVLKKKKVENDNMKNKIKKLKPFVMKKNSPFKQYNNKKYPFNPGFNQQFNREGKPWQQSPKFQNNRYTPQKNRFGFTNFKNYNNQSGRYSNGMSPYNKSNMSPGNRSFNKNYEGYKGNSPYYKNNFTYPKGNFNNGNLRGKGFMPQKYKHYNNQTGSNVNNFRKKNFNNQRPHLKNTNNFVHTNKVNSVNNINKNENNNDD